MGLTQSWSRGSCIPFGLFRVPVVEAGSGFILLRSLCPEMKLNVCFAHNSVRLLSSGETVYGSQGVLFTHIIPSFPADTDERWGQLWWVGICSVEKLWGMVGLTCQVLSLAVEGWLLALGLVGWEFPPSSEPPALVSSWARACGPHRDNQVKLEQSGCMPVGGQCWWLLRLFEAGFSLRGTEGWSDCAVLAVVLELKRWQSVLVMARSRFPFDTTVA